MNRTFLSLLACPNCKKKLVLKGENSLRCVYCQTIYPIKHGVPVLINLKTLPKHLLGQIRYFESSAKKYKKTHVIVQWQQKYIDRLQACLGTYKKKIVVDNASGS